MVIIIIVIIVAACPILEKEQHIKGENTVCVCVLNYTLPYARKRG
jgi:hypothetical protein